MAPRLASTIALVGEALEDHFPGEPPVIGGAPLNVACHLRGLGAETLLVTRIGRDAGGERMMKFLQARGLAGSGVQHDAEHPSGRVDVRVQGARTSFEIPFPQAFDFLDAHAAAEEIVEARPEAVYYGTLAQRNESSRAAVRAALGATRALRFCDLNLRAPWFSEEVVRCALHGADALKLNDEELAAVVAMLELPATPSAARALLDDCPAKTLVVTKGEAGAIRLDREPEGVRESRATPPPVPRLVDTVGAGDAFAAVTLLGLVGGWPPLQALERAGALASAVCGIRGAVPDDASFYAPFRRDWRLA